MTEAWRCPIGHFALCAAAVSVILAAPAGLARAAEPVTLTLKDHRFVPDHTDVPAGERFQIVVENQDDTAGEFESFEMKLEKIVAPGTKITVRAGPLRTGSYKFFDDYHPDTAQGTLTAVEGSPAKSGAN